MLITPNPATPEGEAIIDLAGKLDALQARTGEWPGADTVDILGDWLSRFTFATSTVLPRQVTGRAWVLRRWDRHSDEVTLWSDEASALAELAQHARSSWDNVAGNDGVPHRPPADDQTAIDLYYGPKEHRGDEDYTLYAEDIARHVHTPRSLRACRVAGWLHRDEVLDGFGAGRLAVGFMAPPCWLSGESDEH